MPATLPAPYPRFDPAVYGSGRGIQEVAVWNLDGVSERRSSAISERSSSSKPAGNEREAPMTDRPEGGADGQFPVVALLSLAIPVSLIAAWAMKEKTMAKRKGLSGTPAEHARRAIREEQGAISNFKDVISASKSKDCGLAFTMWTLGAEHAARAESNASDATPGATMSRKVMDAYNDAGNKFRIHCLAKKGLSAAPRRKARKARR